MRVLLLVYIAILAIVNAQKVSTVGNGPVTINRSGDAGTTEATGAADATGANDATGGATGDATGTTVNMDDPNPPKFLDPEGPAMKKIEEQREAAAAKRIAQHREDTRRDIIGVLDTAIKQTTTYAGQQKSACTVEIKATEEWQKESSGKAAEEARKQRNEAKKALREAIIGRESVLKEFLSKLETGKKKLGQSIQNTNNIYTHIYDVNRATETNARVGLHALTFGVIPDGKLLPFQPIKEITGHEHVDQGMTLYKEGNAHESSATAGGAEDNAEAASTTTNTFIEVDATKLDSRRSHYDAVLMELEAGAHKKTAGCELNECKTAYMAIYEIIKQVYLFDCVNFKMFDEKARVPLRKYADGLKHMIEVRKAKLQALAKQREALTRSINGEGQTLANLFPLIRKHADALDIACKKMPTNTDRMLAKLKNTKADAVAKRLMCLPDGNSEMTGESSDVSSATGASSTDGATGSNAEGTTGSSAEADTSSASPKTEDKAPSSSDSDSNSKKEEGSSSPLNNEFDKDSKSNGQTSGSTSNDQTSDSVLDSTPSKQEQSSSQQESVPGNQPPAKE